MTLMRVVQVNMVHPRDRRSAEALIDTRPTLRNIAEAVRRTGAAVTVVQSSDEMAEVTREGVRYQFVAEPTLPGRRVGFAPWRLADAVRSCRPDIVHINGLDFPFHIRALCRIGVPTLVQDHASGAGTRAWLRRWGLAKAAGVAFTDIRQAEPFAARKCFRAGTRLFSVPESSTWFTPGDRDEARLATGMRGDPAVLWVGRLDRNKDPLTILDAIAIAAPSLPDLQLWCCFHEQPLLRQVQARLEADPQLARHVHLLGRVPHAWIEALARAADFFMLGSHREGSGYALIEALACGATPIVSDIPSFRGLTAEGRIGALAPVEDARGFAAALVALAARPREAQRRQAIDHFNRNLSFDAVGRGLREIYAQLIGSGS